MTPRQLIERLHEEICEEIDDDWMEHTALTVPQLMHIKAGLDRALLDAISDDETPCPHDSGRNWVSTQDFMERCGQCGRPTGKMEEVNERQNLSA